ncbi:MAG TPA: hypothetical protein GX707_02980 [Epulopiscium sp.]|nr:hypothetical protein [Candidatus Epulonipiscium sp.]
MKKLKKKFPSYFKRFELPEGATEQRIEVFRACKTHKIDKGSFMPTFEENNYSYLDGEDPSDPGVYSLSTYENPRDVRRFANTNNNFRPPYKIAEGFTEPNCGPSQRTKERKKGRRPKYKSSHIDWWIYENEEPHQHFELIEDFNEYYSNYKRERESE